MTDSTTQNEWQNEPKKNWLVQYFLDFKVLGDNPFAFWAIQFINLLDSIAYFALLGVVTLFLTKNIGMDKVTTGYVVTGFTTFITISLFVAGFVTDSLGIKKSLLIAQVLSLGSRFVIAACGLLPDIPGRGWIVAAALVVSAPGQAMTQTVFQAANKRFSSRKSRSASFNIWYLIMNIGAMVGGLSIDLVRVTLDANLSWIFVIAAVASVLNVVVTGGAIRNAEQVRSEGETDEEIAAAAAAPKKKSMQILREVVRESAFWRFIVLMVAVLGVRAVFAYMYLLMPQYWVEVIETTGSAKTDQGLLQAINPILIVVGLILFIPIANKFNVFKMLVTGAFISAASLLVLCLPWTWFGPTMAEGYFMMSLIMLVVLSIGELVWSPKLTEYTAAIAPHGQEGTYLGLSMMPWFGAKLAVSAMSGHMLERWVPEGRGLEAMCTPEIGFWDRPEAMWVLLFVWAFAGPVVALLCKNWLTKDADLGPAVKSTPEASHLFRLRAAIVGALCVAGCAAFFWKNAAAPEGSLETPGGRGLPGSVRSAKDVQTYDCYFTDTAGLGAKMCKDGVPEDVKGEDAVKGFRKACMNEWYADPRGKCSALCGVSKDPSPECGARCAKLPAVPGLPSTEAAWCSERVLKLD